VAVTSQNTVGRVAHVKAYSESSDDLDRSPSNKLVLIGRSHGELSCFMAAELG